MHSAAIQHLGSRFLACLAGAMGMVCAAAAPAQVVLKDDPEPLRGVELDRKLGATVPMDAKLVDSTGKPATLGQYFNQGKPVVLALVYYNCPMICPLTLQRLQERLNAVPYTVGKDFNVVVVSFDPNNTTEMAAENKARYLDGYKLPPDKTIEAGWTFHTAPPGEARRIAEAVGFKYRLVEETGQYAHPSALTVLTPDGRVAAYVSGLEPEPNDLRLALLAASQGKIATGLKDFFLHRCYLYDPKTGKFSLQATRVMQVGGLVSVVGLTALIAALRAGERARKAREQRAAAGNLTTEKFDTLGPGALPAGPATGQIR